MRSPLIAVLAIMAAVLLAMAFVSLVLGVAVHLWFLIAFLFQLVFAIGFLALATWVVATVWKSVMRR